MHSLKAKLRSNEGITLTALVVTIIVIIILAGITFGTISGKKDIVANAKSAKELAEINEEIQVIGTSANSARNSLMIQKEYMQYMEVKKQAI